MEKNQILHIIHSLSYKNNQNKNILIEQQLFLREV